MAKMIRHLTDAEIRNFEPAEKKYKKYDGGGLYIEIAPTGSKRWYYKYRRPADKKEFRMSLGEYPGVRAAQAREALAAARKLIAAGIDPHAERRAAKSANAETGTFRAIAAEWLDMIAPNRAESHVKSIRGRLNNFLNKWIGDKQLDSITTQDLLNIARMIEARGHRETAHRVIGVASQIFDYAMQTNRASFNPAQVIKGALLPVPRRHMATITKPEAIGRLLVDMDSYPGNFTILCALRLSPLLLLRPGELRRLEWTEIDFEKAEIHLPVEKMKRLTVEKEQRRGEIAHIVPLSTQALSIFRELKQINGPTERFPNRRYVFPQDGHPQKCISNVAVLNALRRLGYGRDEMTAHGFRALASTNLHELGYSSDIIERQLAHVDRNVVRAAYNHAQYLDKRHDMMQHWADWLDEQKLNAGQAETAVSGQGRDRVD